MPWIETLVVTLGSSITKGLIKLWFPDSQWLQGATSSVVTAAAPGATTLLERRRNQRQFDQLEELVAKRLRDLIQIEFADMPENEIEAAIIATAATMDAIAGSPAAEVAKANADPTTLRLLLLSRDPGRADRSYLSDAGHQLYDVLLRESCNYLVSFVKRFIGFQSETGIEILRRESELLRLAEEALKRIPERPGGTTQDEDRLQYIRDIARRLDRMELFGVDLASVYKSYSLTSAWIDLKCVRTDEPSDGAGRRIYDLLSENPRMILRGVAGSGKTTVARSIAVGCAMGSLPQTLDDWNSLTPIYVPLRRLFRGDVQGVPRLSDVLHWMPPNTNKYIDEEAYIRDAAEGRVVFLLDGVDEVVSEYRDAVRDWVLDLLERFGASRFIVTSRPLALDENWSTLGDIAMADISPLSPLEIADLVSKWYHVQMQRQGISPERRAQIAGLRDQLFLHLEHNPVIAEISRTPLLCAVLCALNLSRAGELPRDRMELYRLSLSTLLVRRDLEQGLDQRLVTPLTETETVAILRSFAFWMALNNRSLATVEELRSSVSRVLPSLPGVSVGEDLVTRALLERSGVLRSPEEGSVDFIHKSFQEFLAAGEAMDSGHIDLLVERANSESWLNIVAMASGYATSQQRTTLIERLLAVGDERIKKISHLSIAPEHAAAAMCLQFSPVIEPRLAAEIGKRLEDLMPPSDAARIAVLVATGETGVRVIESWLQQGTRHAQASILGAVSVLRTTGGETALAVLHHLLRVRGHDAVVARAVLNAGLAFDLRLYASEVFGSWQGALDWPVLSVEEAVLAELVAGIHSYAVEVKLSRDTSATEGVVPELPKATSIRVAVDGALDLSGLPIASAVAEAELTAASSLRSYSGLNRSPELSVLTITDAAAIATLSAVDLPALREVRIVSGMLDVKDVRRLVERGVGVLQGPGVEGHSDASE